MKITLALIKKLILLKQGQSIPASSLKGEWVEELLQDGVLISSSRGSQRRISLAAKVQFENALSKFDEKLRDLELAEQLLQSEDQQTRSVQAEDTGNSKLVSTRSCPGFPVNSYSSISCYLNDKQITIEPNDGSFIFISDWKKFIIPANILIVGIENMENFREIRKQKNLFTSLLNENEKDVLFVSRYPQSKDLVQWLQTTSNRYIHFGDFDLAGIHIFQSEFEKYIPGRSFFLIPNDIENRIAKGSKERYSDQYQKFRKIASANKELQHLIELIHKYGRCYDQEGYIVN